MLLQCSLCRIQHKSQICLFLQLPLWGTLFGIKIILVPWKQLVRSLVSFVLTSRQIAQTLQFPSLWVQCRVFQPWVLGQINRYSFVWSNTKLPKASLLIFVWSTQHSTNKSYYLQQGSYVLCAFCVKQNLLNRFPWNFVAQWPQWPKEEPIKYWCKYWCFTFLTSARSGVFQHLGWFPKEYFMDLDEIITSK